MMKTKYEEYLQKCQNIVDVISTNTDEDGFCHLPLSIITEKVGVRKSSSGEVQKRIGVLQYNDGPIEKTPLGYRLRCKNVSERGFFKEMPFTAIIYYIFDDEKIKRKGLSISTFFGMPVNRYLLANVFLRDGNSLSYLVDLAKGKEKEYEPLISAYINKYPDLLRNNIIDEMIKEYKKNPTNEVPSDDQ